VYRIDLLLVFRVLSKIYKTRAIVDSKSYLLVLDPADIHIGKLCSSFEVGEDYNNQIAVQRYLGRGMCKSIFIPHR
jgi:hypothetical protein